MCAYHLVHLRLGEGGLITLVVPPTAIPDQVNENVFMKLIAIGVGYAYCHEGCFGVIGVYMDDGESKTFGKVAGKVCRAIITRFGGKAQLVIYDDAYCAAHPVAREIPQVQGFGDNALAGERGVSLNEDEQGIIKVLDRSACMITCFCEARPMPSTTGFTNFRWLGLGQR